MGVGGGLLSALQGGDSLLSTFGGLADSFTQSQAIKFQGDATLRISEQQARLSDLQAEEAIKQGNKNSALLQEKGKVLKGAQRAALAAQGLDINSGSAADVQEDTARSVALDALQIRNNAWREAWGYKLQSVTTRGQGQLAFTASRQGAKSTLLTGGAQAFSSLSGFGSGLIGSLPSRPPTSSFSSTSTKLSGGLFSGRTSPSGRITRNRKAAL